MPLKNESYRFGWWDEDKQTNAIILRFTSNLNNLSEPRSKDINKIVYLHEHECVVDRS